MNLICSLGIIISLVNGEIDRYACPSHAYVSDCSPLPTHARRAQLYRPSSAVKVVLASRLRRDRLRLASLHLDCLSQGAALRA